MHDLPERFIFTVSSTFEGGKKWLKDLPQLIAECEARWDLTVGPPFAGLSYNYTAPAILSDGTEVVLKLGVPNKELRTEIEALKVYHGRGICRLLDADAEEGLLLLERLNPGTMLTAVAGEDDEEATRIAAGVMRQLWRPLPKKHNFPSVADWAEGLTELRSLFQGGTGPFPEHLVEMAEDLFVDLLETSSEPMLLHGDLHHYNILSSEREPWLAIDPKGISGEPAFEVGALIRNPLDVTSWSNVEQIISRRFDILADHLEMDRRRLVAWCLAQEVLSSWWDYDDLGGEAWQMDTRLAEIFVDMLD